MLKYLFGFITVILCAGLFFSFSDNEKKVQLAAAEEGYMKYAAQALVNELNNNKEKYFGKDFRTLNNIDLYVGGLTTTFSPEIINKKHTNILWLGGYHYVNFSLLRQFDYILTSTNDLMQFIILQGYHPVYMPLFSTVKEREPSACVRNSGNNCFYGIVGKCPMFEKALIQRKFAYKTYAAKPENIAALENDFDRLTALVVCDSQFASDSLDLAPIFFDTVQHKIPLITPTRQTYDFSASHALSLFGDSISWYTLENDIENFLDNPALRLQKANETASFSKRFLSAESGAYTISSLIGYPAAFKKHIENTIRIDVPVLLGFYNNGDYWLSKDLGYALQHKGYEISLLSYLQPFWGHSDVIIYMRGGLPIIKREEDKNTLSVLYLIFPNFYDTEAGGDIKKQYEDALEEYRLMDAVAVPSKSLFETLRADGINAYYVPQFTNTDKFYPDFDEKLKSEVLFVGNYTDYRKAPQIVMKHNLPITIYGNYWPNGFSVNNYIDNKILRKYYSSAKINLNDTRDGMKEYGFISNRIFDVTASGGFVISDYMPEIEAVYGDSVPMWKTEEELVALIKYYLDPAHEAERLEKAKRAQEITLKNFTAEKAAARFDEIINDIRKKRAF